MFGFLITSIYPPIIHRIEKESERERLLDNKNILIDALKCIHRRYTCVILQPNSIKLIMAGLPCAVCVCAQCTNVCIYYTSSMHFHCVGLIEKYISSLSYLRFFHSVFVRVCMCQRKRRNFIYCIAIILSFWWYNFQSTLDNTVCIVIVGCISISVAENRCSWYPAKHWTPECIPKCEY